MSFSPQYRYILNRNRNAVFSKIAKIIKCYIGDLCLLGAHRSCFRNTFYGWLSTLPSAKILGPGSYLKIWKNRANRINLCLSKMQKMHRLALPLLSASLLKLTGCPGDTTARQHTYIRRQHMNNRFIRATQIIGNHQRPISGDTVRRWLITNTMHKMLLSDQKTHPYSPSSSRTSAVDYPKSKLA